MGSLTDVHEIAQALRMDVYRRMRVNAGIGVLRPADEILDAPEGVCRDHAILLATMLRAVGYASRLVSGMVEYQGRFYYHAWVEYWDGKDWIAMDSTRPESQLTSRHIKIAHGSVADAYQSFLLAPERLEVVKEGA
jgi:transglutaminase-like putative cysteine protease